MRELSNPLPAFPGRVHHSLLSSRFVTYINENSARVPERLCFFHDRSVGDASERNVQ